MQVILELIETLWNVNKLTDSPPSFAWIELIETLWNVNQVYLTFVYDLSSRINRNIVECKFTFGNG